MRKFLIVALSLVIMSIAQNGNAKTGLSIKIGRNYPHFKNKAIGLRPGYLISVEKEWRFIKSTLFVSGITVTNIKGTINNVTVGSETGSNTSVRYENIYISVRYIDIPLLLKYYLQLQKDLKLSLIVGPSLSLVNSDKSTRKLIREEDLDVDEWDNYPFDYVLWDGPTAFHTGGGFSFNVGAGFNWKWFTIEFIYSKNNYEIAYAQHLALYEKLSYTLSLLIGIYF